MRKRKNPVQIYLSNDELKKLDEWSSACHMTRSKYLRELIMGSRPVAFPPIEYKEVLRELRAIGVNMNQLAAKAHTLGFADEQTYRDNADRVWRVVGELAEQMVRKGALLGDNKNMGG